MARFSGPAYRAQGCKRGRVYKGRVWGSKSGADAEAKAFEKSGMTKTKVKRIRKVPSW